MSQSRGNTAASDCKRRTTTVTGGYTVAGLEGTDQLNRSDGKVVKEIPLSLGHTLRTRKVQSV